MKIVITDVNETYIKVSCERCINKEISDYFKFRVPGYQFSPKFKSKMWDGYIRLYDVGKKLLFKGLLPSLHLFAKNNEYELETQITESEYLKEYYPAKFDTLKTTFPLRDYQKKAVVEALEKKRCVILSPTGSGKSFIIYSIIQYLNVSTLLIVPTTSLVHQMFSDFQEYSVTPDKVIENFQLICEGRGKAITKKFVIATWQSIQREPNKYFKDFKCVIADEAHQYKNNTIGNIIKRMIYTPYRFALTGTLQDSKMNIMMLEGLFGKIYTAITTKELIKQGYLAQLLINCILLKYPDSVRKENARSLYQDEISLVNGYTQRTRFIANLAYSNKENTLILFQRVETHGELIFKELESINQSKKKQIFFVSGKVKASIREEIRAISEKASNVIIVASYGTFSEGINIKNLHNIIFASPYKSKIKVIQSIGRGLRTHESKKHCVLWDLVDDLVWKKYRNYGMEHFLERKEHYANEGHIYDLIGVQLK